MCIVGLHISRVRLTNVGEEVLLCEISLRLHPIYMHIIE